MAHLIPPTQVKRRRPYFEHPKPGKWHVCRDNPQMAVCGVVMSEHATWYTWEASTIERVRARDLCRECWPYEAVDTPDLGPLFGGVA